MDPITPAFALEAGYRHLTGVFVVPPNQVAVCIAMFAVTFPPFDLQSIGLNFPYYRWRIIPVTVDWPGGS